MSRVYIEHGVKGAIKKHSLKEALTSNMPVKIQYNKS